MEQLRISQIFSIGYGLGQFESSQFGLGQSRSGQIQINLDPTSSLGLGKDQYHDPCR